MIKIILQLSSYTHLPSKRVFPVSLFLGATLAVMDCATSPAHAAFDIEHPAAVSVQLQQQGLNQLFQEKMKGSGPDAVARVRTEFLEYLRRNSPIASEKLFNGKMDDEELNSRVDVFLRDRAAQSLGYVSVEQSDPRTQVAELLRREPAIASTDAERLALADRFLERLGQRSSTARNELLRGKMPSDELQSRVSVFIADLQAEAAAAPVDASAVAVRALVESYLKANFAELANDMSYKAEIDAKGVKREFTIFKKRPGKVRVHIVEDSLVIGALGFDGVMAWRQEPGKAGIPTAGAEAGMLKQVARFDDPLVGYRERGTVVKLLEEKSDKGPIKLQIRESDGTEMVAEIDPVTNTELSLRTLMADGTWSEVRFSDYRKVGGFNFAFVQEEWSDGKLRSTTKVSEVRLDSGLIDQFFVPPVDPVLSYMDYMGGLAAIKAKQKQRPSTVQQPAFGGSK